MLNLITSILFIFDYCHLPDFSDDTLAAFSQFYRAHCPDRIIVNIVPADQFFD